MSAYWMMLFIIWWVCWRPGMVEWWREHRIAKTDLEEIRGADYIEDMFKW